MNFSDIRGTDALDLLVDIIDPASNIMSDDDFKKMVRSGAPRLEIAKTLIKSHKQDVLAILAAADHTPVKKYNPSLTQIIKKRLKLSMTRRSRAFFSRRSRARKTMLLALLRNLHRNTRNKALCELLPCAV